MTTVLKHLPVYVFVLQTPPGKRFNNDELQVWLNKDKICK